MKECRSVVLYIIVYFDPLKCDTFTFYKSITHLLCLFLFLRGREGEAVFKYISG